MKTKIFEIRDDATFIPVICMEMKSNERQESYLLSRLGFSKDTHLIQLVWVGHSITEWDPFKWHDRTMFTAHKYITENWESLNSGEVIDVEWILGENDKIKKSESEG